MLRCLVSVCGVLLYGKLEQDREDKKVCVCCVCVWLRRQGTKTYEKDPNFNHSTVSLRQGLGDVRVGDAAALLSSYLTLFSQNRIKCGSL